MPTTSIDFIVQTVENAGATCGLDKNLDFKLDAANLRMLNCLAIDVKAGCLSSGIVASVVADTETRNELAEKIALHVGETFECCTCDVSETAGQKVVSFMGIRKYLIIFRGKAPASIGTAEMASAINYLQYKRRAGGAIERQLSEPLKCYDRPVTWVTPLDAAKPELASTNGDLAAARITEFLGLPWKPGQHEVIAMIYPDILPLGVKFGKPTSFCECWDDPGAFVPSPNNSGWGQTAGRTRADHPGWPERVHSPIDATSIDPPFLAFLVGKAYLKPLESNVADAEALKRWQSIA